MQHAWIKQFNIKMKLPVKTHTNVTMKYRNDLRGHYLKVCDQINVAHLLIQYIPQTVE